MRHLKKTAMIALFGMMSAGTVLADELGQAEYMNACASCHGASAAGDGPMAELMTVPVPALTGLSAANDGNFPMLEVIHAIDGRQGTRGHGYPMPIWGDRFLMESGVPDSFGNEAIVRGRVLSIAYYLESIQN